MINAFATNPLEQDVEPAVNIIMNSGMLNEFNITSSKEDAFLSELREFMNEFAETDLNIDSIEEAVGLNKSQANFYVKLYNQILAEEDEINKLCDEEIERVNKSINLFREKSLKSLSYKKEHFESILKDFAMKELEGKKVKTIKLPYGSLSFKKQQPKYIYGNEDLIKLTLKNVKPELIKSEVVEKIDKVALKKNAILKDDGLYIEDTLIDSIEVQVQADKFEVKKSS